MTRNKKIKEQQAYSALYPSALSWSRRMWVVQENDLFEDSQGNLFKVKQVIRSHIPGAKPRIVMEPVKSS